MPRMGSNSSLQLLLLTLTTRNGSWALADGGGADFAHGGVTAALAGAPHVPTGDGAIGAPAFAEREEFLGLGHMLFAVGDGPAFFDAEVVDGENVGAAEAEDQEHFDGPGADAADRDETFDELFVGEFFGLFEGGDDAVDGFLLRRDRLCARRACGV